MYPGSDTYAMVMGLSGCYAECTVVKECVASCAMRNALPVILKLEE